MFGIGHIAELVALLVIVLIFFGPKRLPEIASGLGRSITEFRKATKEEPDGQLSGTKAERLAEPRYTADPIHNAAAYAATPLPSDREATRT